MGPLSISLYTGDEGQGIRPMAYHEVVKGDTTLSPTLSVFTAEPASVTVPVNSWPMTKPLPHGSRPRYAWSSLTRGLGLCELVGMKQ